MLWRFIITDSISPMLTDDITTW